MASGKRKKGKKNGLFAKLAAAVIVIAAGVFSADYFNIFTFEEWKEFFVIEKESVAEGEVQTVNIINIVFFKITAYYFAVFLFSSVN